MNHFKFIACSICLFISFSIHGQERKPKCGAHSHYHNPERDAILMKKFKHQLKHTRTEDEKFIIPIIFHIVHGGQPVGQGANISAEQIYSQIEVLNEDFNRQNTDTIRTREEFLPVAGVANIQFVPAYIDEAGNVLPEAGIHRVQHEQQVWFISDAKDELIPDLQWNPTQYFNVVVVDKFVSGIGYSQFPDFSDLPMLDEIDGTPQTDAILIRHDRVGSYAKYPAPQLEGELNRYGRTLTHEFGHSFGLRHTWGDTICGDDGCDDTPMSNVKYYCELEDMSCEPNSNIHAMRENFMEYSDDYCMNIFTKCQIARMHHVLRNSPRRKELTYSPAIPPESEPEHEPVVNIESQNFSANIEVYPIPAQNQLIIKNLPQKSTSLILRDMTGRKVKNIQYQQNVINLPKLADGLYILELNLGDEIFRTKIIIQQT